MLERLLGLLRDGGSYHIAGLAQALDTTPALVRMMLEDLARRGYLRSVGAKCNGQCNGCALAGLCAVGTDGQVWALTEQQ
ncbi:MAG: Lrp/AsnC family transcriptional regulator [Anaerolineae bacterium]|nr:Lrp/AsnC family transcriptional regulator [Anaerolineae bacterium]